MRTRSDLFRMPSKFRIKDYQPNSYYHIYNRGIDQRSIFNDEADYLQFLTILKRYLGSERDNTRSGFKGLKPSLAKKRSSMKLGEEVALICYCLMPNHFHLVVKQTSSDGIVKLMRRVCTNYSMYFNRKYQRHSTLFEGVYRAIRVPEEKLHYLSRFVHLNPVARAIKRFGLVETVIGVAPSEYPYSSYKDYLQQGNSDIVTLLPTNDSYAKFIDSVSDGEMVKQLMGLMIDQ